MSSINRVEQQAGQQRLSTSQEAPKASDDAVKDFTKAMKGMSVQEAPKASEGAVNNFTKAMKGLSVQGQMGEGAAAQSALDGSPFGILPQRGRKDGESGGQENSQDKGQETIFLTGDAVLANMGGTKEIPSPGTVAGADTASRIDADITAKLVDRILVSAPDATGGAEVRISLREDILPGTEIRIQRQADGGISVQFVTGDIRGEQMLGARQIGDLQNVLAGSLGVEVRVSTVRPDGSMSADAGAGGEQGHGGKEGQGGSGGNGGQSRDGRSRQHDIFDAMQDTV
ncbi:MAG: hypothetical protein LBV80_06015 [Deltaproteobacteria bacterium]|jgi:hypothetical protein|nr:hypothetical protein [Deltaproteobacteria bacterium]